ncbi:MAG: VanW family protein, partial [Actinomycetota bacterium]|nr:VanW family protein [Actinomycetota bacterium]
PVLDEKALLRRVEPALTRAARAPEDATVRLVGGRPEVVPGRTGVTFDREDITDGFLEVVAQEDGERTLEAGTVKGQPEFTAADARKLRIRRVVSSSTTNYPHADYRNTNQGRAAELVTGTVLRPGETFSFNSTVGERTAANGFVEGFIISDGIFEEDFGGGVSQVVTTLFNAAFFAGLEDVEHQPHSFYIDRYPIGREATVAWGVVDLRFKNDTPHGILIEADIDPSSPGREGAMNVKMWSTKHWDIKAGVSKRHNFTKEDTRFIDDQACEPNDGYRGFDIDVYRYFREPGKEKVVRKETLSTTYTPSDTVICR